jgi:hypothetical protein
MAYAMNVGFVQIVTMSIDCLEVRTAKTADELSETVIQDRSNTASVRIAIKEQRAEEIAKTQIVSSIQKFRESNDALSIVAR